MATKKEKQKVLNSWHELFPEYTPWKDQWLLQLNGGVLSGICLDKTSDKEVYQAVFFFHNLLVPSSFISISNHARLKGKHIAKNLKYANFQESDVVLFKKQVRALREPISFEVFLDHIENIYNKTYVSIPPFVPHLLKGIAAIGSYAGDEEFYKSSLPNAKKLLERYNPCLNFEASSEGFNKWEEEVITLIESDGKEIINSEIEKHGLPNLKDMQMPYKRVDDYIEKIDEYIQKFYPASRIKQCLSSFPR